MIIIPETITHRTGGSVRSGQFRKEEPNMDVQYSGQILRLSNGREEKHLHWIQPGLIRIYKSKNSEELVRLNLEPKAVELLVEHDGDDVVARWDDYLLKVDEALNVAVYREGRPCFAEYTGDASVYTQKKEFSLAELEGHKRSEAMADFKTQISVAIFDDSDKFYGLGDKAAALNRRGYEYVSWNTDDPTAHNESYRSLYKSINYLLVNHHNDRYYGLFYPSSYRCVFDLGKYSREFFYIGSQKGEYDYFLILGKTPMDITGIYSGLVGRPLFVPRKMLGYHQSRWSYGGRELGEVAERFAELKLPLDYIHMDIDYMERYKVYTVDRREFPDLKQTARELGARGVDLITIVDPGVKVEQGYFVHDELEAMGGFATLDGESYVNQVWPGDSKFPNYFRKEVADYVTRITEDFMEENAVAGIWCDMNEPASFRGPLPDEVEFPSDKAMHTHEEVHNLYGEYMCRAVSEAFTKHGRRPAVITRAAFATSSPFTTTWNGDNQSLWHHLAVSLPQVMTMNLCNFPMNGVDIGGFGGDTNPELLIRWIQANVFSPFLRNHTSLDTRHQEPYAFDQKTLELYRGALDIRYGFLPYLYDLLEKDHRTGEPVQRPLFFDYPADPQAKERNDQVMVGPNVMLCPVVHQGQTSRVVFFPQGRWVDYFTGTVYEGGKEYLVSMPLEAMGLYVKAGAIVPMYRGLTHIDDEKLDTLYLYIAKGGDGEYLHYEDDGRTLDYTRGICNRYRITKTADVLRFETVCGNFPTRYKQVVILWEGKEIAIPFAPQFVCRLAD